MLEDSSSYDFNAWAVHSKELGKGLTEASCMIEVGWDVHSAYITEVAHFNDL